MPCRIGKPRTIERSATRWGRRVGSQIMVSKFCLLVLIYISLFIASGTEAIAQSSPDIHVTVNMVQLNVAVTDKKGNYITGLQPKDFAIYEDGILEKPATFAEGNEPARNLGELADSAVAGTGSGAGSGAGSTQAFSDLVSGANVFVLFDTSGYMYRGFVFARDAISAFIRS